LIVNNAQKPENENQLLVIKTIKTKLHAFKEMFKAKVKSHLQTATVIKREQMWKCMY